MPGTRSGDEIEFPAIVELGYTYGSSEGVKLRVLDESSRAVVFEISIPIERWGAAVRGSGDVAGTARVWEQNLDRIGKVFEHREIVVPTIRDSRDYDRADELTEAWLDETRPGWREAGWAVSIPRGDGSTPTNGWNGHRRTADGYKLTIWRYVDPEKTTTVDDERYCDWCDSTEHWATDCDQRPVETDSIPAPDPDVVLAETTIVDVARLYGVTPQTVMRWARKAATDAKTEVPS